MRPSEARMLYPISEPIADSIKDRFGYIDDRGNVAVPPSYSACSHFFEGKASVIDKTEKTGFIPTPREGWRFPISSKGLEDSTTESVLPLAAISIISAIGKFHQRFWLRVLFQKD